MKPFGLPAQAAVGFFAATGRSCAVGTVRRNDSGNKIAHTGALAVRCGSAWLFFRDLRRNRSACLLRLAVGPLLLSLVVFSFFFLWLFSSKEKAWKSSIPFQASLYITFCSDAEGKMHV